MRGVKETVESLDRTIMIVTVALFAGLAAST